jgi:peptide deformylase
MQAVCLQHEMDHLEGRLFIDRLPFLRRLRARRALAAKTARRSA